MNFLASTGDVFFGRAGHPLSNIMGVSTLVSLFLSNAIIVAGVILLFIIIFAGYGIISAGGNPQKVAAAMKLLTYGIAGFLLIFATFFIIRIVEGITGVTIL